MTTSRGHAPSHARLHKLHKRTHSASASPAPSPSISSNAFASSFVRSDTPIVTYEESWPTSPSPMTSTTSSHPLNLKPYLRKLSPKDTNASLSLDLSRPAAENNLSGLGISEYGGYCPSVADVSFAPVNGRHRRTRSASSTSQFSTSSALQRPTPLPPIRQTPQSYTPPISESTPPSVRSSEHDHDHHIMSEEDFRLRQNTFDRARRSDSLSSVPGASLRLHANNSSTRLHATYSHSSISLTSPVTQTHAQSRSRGDTIKSIDAPTSPSSRTSFDHTYRFIRGGRDSPVDATSRAASIRAARMRFDEKERAKEHKYEKEASKQQERDARRQLKKEDNLRRKSETFDRNDYTRSPSASDSQNEKGARIPVVGRQYSDHREVHPTSLPKYVTTVDPEKQSAPTPHVTKSRAAKGTWLRFITWFKTRLLRISKG